MPTINGLVTSYDVPTNARDISDIFYALAYPQTNMLNAIGVGDSAENTKHIWWEDKLLATKSALTANYTAASGTIVIDPTQSKAVRPDMLIRIGRTILRAKVITYATGSITVDVVSADVNHVIGDEVKFLNTSRKENAGYDPSDYTPEEERSNQSQIMDDYTNFSRTQRMITREVNMGDIVDQQVMKKLDRLYHQLGDDVWNGFRVVAPDNDDARALGGIYFFVEENGYNPSSTAFSIDNIDAFLLKMKIDYHAELSELWMNPSDRKRFNALNTSETRVTRSERVAGGYVDTYESGHGDIIKLMTDDNCIVKKLALTQPKLIKLIPLKGSQFFIEPLPKTTDGYQNAIRGEYTLEVNPSNTMGIFSIT